jgi:hypothetical protein
MCKTNMKIDIYYVNMLWKEHDKAMVQDCG